MVDAVVNVKRGADLYDAVPSYVTDPADFILTAGSLHCGTLLIPKIIKQYMNSARDQKLAVVCKGCDVMAFYEMAKRNQMDLGNILMISVNCGGSVSPVAARKMIKEKFDVDPDAVTKEEIDKGQFIIEYDGQHKGIKIDDLEEEGYGRRSNCRRCKMKIPRQADIVCGNWGVIGDKAGRATFVEICSEKGAKEYPKYKITNSGTGYCIKRRKVIFYMSEQTKGRAGMLKQRYPEEIELMMKTFFRTLSEKDRRRYAAIEAQKLGNGGQQYICKILGCDPSTVRKGTGELQEKISTDKRIRQPGGGRKKIIETIENIDAIFIEILSAHTAGSPMDGAIKWTNLTQREISDAFAQRGMDVTEHVVKQLLGKHGYVKRKMQKTVTMKDTTNRNEQFKKIQELKEEYEKSENPIISIDVKKKKR